MPGPDPLEALPTDPEDVVRMEPEDLGWYVLGHLDHLGDARQSLNIGNFGKGIERRFGDQVAEALVEGSWWLVREGFLIPTHRTSGSASFYRISRRERKERRAGRIREAYAHWTGAIHRMRPSSTLYF